MATGRKEKRGSGGTSRFYCEMCGREVPPEDEYCPYCGTPFYAVKCPRCGHIDKAMSFIYGCPSCGYLSPEQRKAGQAPASRPRSSRAPGAAKTAPQQSPTIDPRDEAARQRGADKKGGSDLFTTFLLVFLLLVLGVLMVVYVVF